MNREKIIENTVAKLKVLPEYQIILACEFTDFLYQKYEEYILNKVVQELTNKSKSFEFLAKDDNLYTVNDIKGKYNARG